jgi:hypothetical protein
MICPNCKQGRLYPAIPHEGFPEPGLECDICKGYGILPDCILYDPTRGDTIKTDRILRGATLRDEAIRLNRDASWLSRRERGFFMKGESN